MVEKIQVLTHSSIRIDSENGVVYFDPFKIRENMNDADFIFITHDHYDHLSPEDIRKVMKENTVFFAPEKIADKLKGITSKNNKIYPVKPGAFYEKEYLEFDTVPAYNNLKPFHPKAAGFVGYVVRLEGKRIYVAGDTSLTSEAKAVKCDIALVPVGGLYTMDAKKAAELINIIRPEYAIPTHYGSVAGTPEDGNTFKSLVKSPIKVAIKMEYFE